MMMMMMMMMMTMMMVLEYKHAMLAYLASFPEHVSAINSDASDPEVQIHVRYISKFRFATQPCRWEKNTAMVLRFSKPSWRAGRHIHASVGNTRRATALVELCCKCHCLQHGKMMWLWVSGKNALSNTSSQNLNHSSCVYCVYCIYVLVVALEFHTFHGILVGLANHCRRQT